MNREKLVRTKEWADTVNMGIQDAEPGAFLVRCVLNVLDDLIDAILAEPDYYDDGTPGEYGDDLVVDRFKEVPDEKPMQTITHLHEPGPQCEHDWMPLFETGKTAAVGRLCRKCGQKDTRTSGYGGDNDPVDHTTNPDGTRTPTDDDPINVGRPGIRCPHCGKISAYFGYADKHCIWYKCRECYWTFDAGLPDSMDGTRDACRGSATRAIS